MGVKATWSGLLLFCLCGFSAWATSDWPQLARIQDEGVLRVAYWPGEGPPFCYHDEEGEPAGLGIAVARDVAAQLGVTAEFLVQATPGDVLDAVSTKRADMSATWLTMTPARALRVFFTRPVVTFKLSLLASIIGDAREGLALDPAMIWAARERLQFGAFQKHSHIDLLRIHYPGARVREFSDWPTVLDALGDGTLYALMSDEFYIRRILHLHPELALSMAQIVLPETRDAVAIAVRPDAPDLHAWLDVYVFTELADLDAEFLLNDYFAPGAHVTFSSSTGELAAAFQADGRIFSIESDGKHVEERSRVYLAFATAFGLVAFIILLMFCPRRRRQDVCAEGVRTGLVEGRTGSGFGLVPFLRSPWVIFGGCCLGVVIGIFMPDVAPKLAIVGNMFFAFMMMCTLPIILSAVIGSLGRMFHAGHAIRKVMGMAGAFLLVLVFTASVAYVAAALGRPGMMLGMSEKQQLGQAVTAAGSPAVAIGGEVVDVWSELIPQNIFEALGRGSILGVLVFSILIGAAIGLIRDEASGQIIRQAEALFAACQRMIDWGMLALPVGVCCFIAVQVAQTGYQILLAVAGLFLVLHIAAIFVVLVNNMLLARASGVSYFRAFFALRDALVVAFVTGNSFAPIPCALAGLHKNLRLDSGSTNLVLPFGVTLCNPGAVVYIVTVSVFFAQLYDVSIYLGGHWLLITLGAVLASIGTAGGGPAIYGLLALVFVPMGLPLMVAIPLLLAVDQFFEPILTVVDIHANCAVAAMLANPESPERALPPLA